MNLISLTFIPNFHRNTTDDPRAFLFKFYVSCQSYEYSDDIKTMKYFPTTLTVVALIFFMSLVSKTIAYWDDVNKDFLRKYE